MTIHTNATILNKESIDSYIANIYKSGTDRIWRSEEKLVLRIARFLSMKYNISSLPNSVFYEAILFDIYTLLFFILPYKRVAQHIKKYGSSSFYILELPFDEIKILNEWGCCGIEFIYLYELLKKYKIETGIRINSSNKNDLTSIRVEFDKQIEFNFDNIRSIYNSESVSFPLGLRNYHLIQSIYCQNAEIRFNYGKSKLLYLLNLRKTNSFGSAEIFDIVDNGNNKFNIIVQHLLCNQINYVYDVAKNFFKEARPKYFHMSDHVFMSNTVFAYVAKSHGVHITLWPHSIHPCFAGVRDQRLFDSVISSTESGRLIWKSNYPDKSVYTDSSLFLKSPGLRMFPEPSGKYNIVLFDMPEIVGVMPIVDRMERTELIENLFRGLEDCSGINIYIKKKPGWNDSGKFNALKSGVSVNYIEDNLFDIKLRNLIVLSISSVSSANFEAISIGAFSAVIKSMSDTNYVNVDFGAISFFNVDEFVSLMKSKDCKSMVDKYRSKQLNWVACTNEFNFNTSIGSVRKSEQISQLWSDYNEFKALLNNKLEENNHLISQIHLISDRLEYKVGYKIRNFFQKYLWK